MRVLKKVFKLTVFFSIVFFFLACSGGGSKSGGEKVEQKRPGKITADPMKNKGVGPISNVVLNSEIDQPMADVGKVAFEKNCTACHKVEKKHIGPALKDVVNRRSPEWIMNMILNPEEMVKMNSIAKQLLIEYNGSPMANQNLTEEEARSILEYFRSFHTTQK